MAPEVSMDAKKSIFAYFCMGGRVSKTCRIVAWTVLSVIFDD